MPNLLDVDPSIMERNLLLKELEGGAEDMADSLFSIKPKEPDDIPWKPVKPNPGYCVKLRTLEGDKVFVNVCHTDSIPEPDEISEEKLLQLIMDDQVPSFRISISIGDLHIESDKSRNPCSVYDICVNSKFFKKMESSEVFNTFFLNVSIPALQEKYSLDLDLKSEKTYVLLKNRKVFGNLQVHRIQQREPKKAPGQLIQEISSTPAVTKNLIEVIGGDRPEKKDNVQPKSILNQSKLSSQVKKSNEKSTNPTDKGIVNIESVPSGSKEGNATFSATLKNKKQVSFPIDDSEKGIKESQETKYNTAKVLEDRRLNVGKKEERLTDISPPSIERHEEVRQKQSSDSCSGLFCIKQYPEKGYPQLLLATVRLNVKSSRDFDLELDTNRLSICTKGSQKPWFDVFLPYNIDVNKVEACFITESQKLLVKMDVVKS